jgi:DNA invertase Pin-like site-specific DNA recombinase
VPGSAQGLYLILSDIEAARAELVDLLSLHSLPSQLNHLRSPPLRRGLQDIVRLLKSKKVNLRATEQPIDTSSAAGKAFLDMLGVFAEFETNLRRERQLEGIAKAKAEGVYKGRKPSISREKIVALRNQGLGASEIAKRLGIGRASVYRLM